MPLLECEDEDAYFFANDLGAYSVSGGYQLEVQAYNVTEEDLDKFADALFEAGWSVEEDHGTYVCMYGDFGVVPLIAFTADTIASEGYAYILATLGQPRVYSFDNIYLLANIMFQYNTLDITAPLVPMYEAASEDVYYLVNTLNLNYNSLDAYVFNSNAQEAAAYAEALAQYGWSVTYDENNALYTASSAPSGKAAVVRIDVSDPEEIEISYSLEYLIAELNPEEIANWMAFQWNSFVGSDAEVVLVQEDTYGFIDGYWALPQTTFASIADALLIYDTFVLDGGWEYADDGTLTAYYVDEANFMEVEMNIITVTEGGTTYAGILFYVYYI